MNRRISKFINDKVDLEMLANSHLFKKKDAGGVRRRMRKMNKQLWMGTPHNKRKELNLKWAKQLQTLLQQNKKLKK